ncbi:hypothetical protein NLU13_8034 [Sarocladium strictum]|uniref:Uncharacterized protein n=1 Tax=Sarocladium strictum TaxID=5046 RepID=A0AA39L4K8_SARSR|nr:hypothetical protein NLU13_8034 [Sarocladium strictum]
MPTTDPDTASICDRRPTSIKGSNEAVGTSAIQLHHRKCHDLQTVLDSFEGKDASLREGGSSWTDVLESMAAAREDYNQKRRETKAGSVHANKSTIATLEMLTDMIPDQDGLSILRGGLKVVFKLVQRRIYNREEILGAFEDIPLTFLRACEKLQTHPNDAELHSYVEELFGTLLEQIPKLVNILLRQHKGSLPSRIFKQHPEHEASIISSCVEAVSRASRRVSDRIGVLEGKVIVETLRETQSIGLKVDETSAEIHLLQRGQAQLDLKLEEQSARARAEIPFMINMAMNPIYTELQTMRHVLMASLSDPSWLRAGLETLQQEYAQLPWQPGEALPSSTSGPTSSTEMFCALGLPDPELVDNDIYQALQTGNKMRAAYRHTPLEQAGYVLLETRFQIWIQPSNNTSDVILVHGRLGNFTEGKISGLSVVAAMFSTVRHFPRFVILHHFCGLHDRYRDAGSGPVGLLQSLIAQLLVHINGNSGFTVLPGMQENSDHLQSAADGNFASLCWLFGFLYCQLKVDLVVYCIIDGIDSFEGGQEGWAEQMCDVVELLTNLAAGSGSRGPVLKLLLTAAKRSVKVHHRLDRSCQIWLSEDKKLPHNAHQSVLRSDLDRAIAFQPSKV